MKIIFSDMDTFLYNNNNNVDDSNYNYNIKISIQLIYCIRLICGVILLVM